MTVLSALFAAWVIALTWLSGVKIRKKFVGGYELDVLLLILVLALVAVGSELYSIDHLLGLWQLAKIPTYAFPRSNSYIGSWR